MILPSLHSCIATWMAIYVGGKIRVDLPPSISSTPVTLHTLSASWAGMKFGPYAGSMGAAIHALTWCYLHYSKTPNHSGTIGIYGRRRLPPVPCSQENAWPATIRSKVRIPPSCGYILGMVPCAALSGCIVTVGGDDAVHRHPVAAAAMGQTLALLVGSLWISKLENAAVGCGRERWWSDGASWRRNFVPFLPGLLVKSVLAWGLLEWSRKVM